MVIEIFEKDMTLPLLIDLYGQVLSDRKRELLDYYYNDDLSLAEIAEEIGISRQGVRELIKKAGEELMFYEEKLGLAKRFQLVEAQTEHLLSLMDKEGVAGDVRKAAKELLETVGG